MGDRQQHIIFSEKKNHGKITTEKNHGARPHGFSSPTELIKEFEKLGYRLDSRSAKPVEFTQADFSRPTQLSVKHVLESAPKGHANTLSFETDDVEIKRFIATLKIKRILKRVAAVAVAAAVIVALVMLFRR